ncbi:unnamed protein product [Phytomonas sp. EM1]|nr:unnamed protein product [Phytomonas sp. EM1]|eukprot:CCW63044.1 unnamed protein product [Phytomonas sp. isolate EM1]
MDIKTKKECGLAEDTQHLWADSAPAAVAKAVLAQPLSSPWRFLLQQSCLYRQHPEAVPPMVLAAMVLSFCDADTCFKPIDGESPLTPGCRFLCVSLATGTRCSGAILEVKDFSMRHFLISDGHAEVLARRSLLAFLLDAVRSASRDGCCFGYAGSQPFVVRDSENNGWRLRSDVRVHLVVTHWPCGSMALSATSRTGGHLLLRTPSAKLFGAWEKDCVAETEFEDGCPDDSVKHSTIYVCHHIVATHESMCERDPHYTHCCRVKPGKGHPNLNMSCSDKLWRWSVFGLQGRRCMRILTQPIRLNSIEVAVDVSTDKGNGSNCVSGIDQAKNALDSLLWKTCAFEEQVGAGGCGSHPVPSPLPLPNISVFSIEQLYGLGDDIPKGAKGACDSSTISDSGYSRCSWMTNLRFSGEVPGKAEKLLVPMGVNSPINSPNHINDVACCLGIKRSRVSDPVTDTDNNLKVRPTRPLSVIEATWKGSSFLTLNTKAGLPQGVSIQQLNRALEKITPNLFMRYPLSRAWMEARVESAQNELTKDMGCLGYDTWKFSPCKDDAFKALLYGIPNSSSSSEKKLLWVMKHYDTTNTSKNT